MAVEAHEEGLLQEHREAVAAANALTAELDAGTVGGARLREVRDEGERLRRVLQGVERRFGLDNSWHETRRRVSEEAIRRLRKAVEREAMKLGVSV